jgi:hypothetical protein
VEPLFDVIEIVLRKVRLKGMAEINANVTKVQVDGAQKRFEVDLGRVSWIADIHEYLRQGSHKVPV